MKSPIKKINWFNVFPIIFIATYFTILLIMVLTSSLITIPACILVGIYMYHKSEYLSNEKAKKKDAACKDAIYTINELSRLNVLDFSLTDINNSETDVQITTLPLLWIRLEVSISKKVGSNYVLGKLTSEQLTYEAQKALLKKFKRDGVQTYQVSHCEIIEHDSTDTFIFVLTDSPKMLIREEVYSVHDTDFSSTD